VTLSAHRPSWGTIPLRYVCRLNPIVDLDGLTTDDDLTFLPMDKVKAGYFIPNTARFSKYASSYNTFEDGDIILAKVTPCFENGNIAIARNLAGGKGFGSSELFVIRPTSVAREFLFYYFQSTTFKQEGEASMTGAGGLKRVSSDVLRQHRLPFPDQDTQRLVANYLDHETAHIDNLIAEKEHMLALLEEKRAALISRFVTRGLDTNGPLKPSGQEWVGDIPIHWEIQPIKYLAVIGNGSTPSVENADYWDDEGYPWLNSSVVNVSPVMNASRFVTETAIRNCHLPKIQPPAVLVGITGQGKTRGMAAVLGIEATINQHLAFIKPRTQKLDTNYLGNMLGHSYAFLRSESDGSGSTKGAITCEQLANMKIPVPPRSEQIEICARIRQSLDVSETLRLEIQRSLNLLTVRRAALITAAVTGQIPVKELSL
jgi:type I restriction enzyme S subunit